MKPEWKRAQVWSEHDARQRRRTSLLAAAGSALLATLWIANYSCFGVMFLDDPAPRASRNNVAPPMARCERDADCVVLPAIISCCGECPPAPPFEAALRSELDELRSDCTPGERQCEAPLCGRVPAGCTATAVCREGECRAVSSAECEGF